MLHDPLSREMFPILGAEDITEITKHGEKKLLADGEVLFRQGEPGWSLHIVISGKLRVTKLIGSEEKLLAFHGPGHFSGDLGVLIGGNAGATGMAVGPTEVVRVAPQTIRRLIGDSSPLGDVLLTAMAGRSREVVANISNEEKLAALGKMSAGLAHELNNPAAAAQRAAKLMLETVLDAPLRMLEMNNDWTPEERESVRAFARDIRCRIEAGFPKVDALELSDREEALNDWFDENALTLTPEGPSTIANASISVEQLRIWQKELGRGFLKFLHWLEAVLKLAELARDVESSTGRIVELVVAMKEYTYMDQAKFQEIDIHRGIDSTLKIMNHKLKKGIVVKQCYDLNAPKICAYPGELNQVWTNLIDNAVDAMHGEGILTIRTKSTETGVLVEIGDTGDGVPDNIKSRIFEPFFTTKGIGKGTGLGLDICYRIVTNRHGGQISVRSKPGDTVFSVCLPANPPLDKDRFDESNAALVETGEQAI